MNIRTRPSYLNDQSKVRGIRNNNPGNIRVSLSRWSGKVQANQDGDFEQFYDIVYGLRAMIRLLFNYIHKDGLDTIAKIIPKYAPSHENNTENYIAYVCRRSGLARDTKLNFFRGEAWIVVRAMVELENGADAAKYIPFHVFNQAYLTAIRTSDIVYPYYKQEIMRYHGEIE